MPGSRGTMPTRKGTTLLDEETIERIVEKVLRRLLIELSEGGQVLPRLSPEEVQRAMGSLSPAPAPVFPSAPPVASPMQFQHPGRLLSEDELVSYFRRGIRMLQLAPRCLVTPAARDRARDLQVDLIEG
jgi:hypothetical protein